MSWKERLKNHFLRGMVSFFSPKKKNPFHLSSPRLLVVSSTALGDTLWATPGLAAIKEKFPTSYLAVLCQKRGREILKNNPAVDAVFSFQEPLFFSFVRLFFSLRSKSFQAIIIFHASQRLIFPLCALLGAEKMVGFQGKNKGLDSLFSQLVNPPKMHEIEKRALLLEMLGIPCKKQDLLYFPLPEEEQRIHHFLQEKKMIKKPLLILHPGASDIYRRWPADSFIALGNQLISSLNCTLLISGVQKERKLIFLLSSHIPQSIPLYPPLPLRDFAALLKKVSLLITNDSGPLHLALATKTRTLALFLPTDPKISGAHLSKYGFSIEAKPPCSPCLGRNCPDPFCWKKISVSSVLEKARELLQESL